MSFNGQSNPWQRNSVFQPVSGQQSIFLQQTHSTMSSFGHAPIFSPGATGTISYPQTRASGLNPVAFQQQQTATSGQTQHYNSMGTVTKLNGDCGLVNDEILFYRHVCKGQIPIVGDRVVFDASYNGSGQFKWTASRIQLISVQNQSQQPQPLLQKASLFNSLSSQGDYQRNQQQHMRKSPQRSLERDRHLRSDRRDRIRHSRDREEEENERKRRREDPNRDRMNNTLSNRPPHNVVGRFDRNREDAKKDRTFSLERKDRERDRDRDRERDRDKVEREREREKDRSPYKGVTKPHRGRVIRRYSVHIPKLLLPYKQADIQELRKRYSTLYIPSDFFHANIKWPDSFPPDNPFSLRRPCQFHIMHKIVDPPFEQKADELEPADADYRYSAKVMLMACPPITEIYQKCFEEDDSDTEHTVHPSRLISFLVGTRGRNEPMAIGGPWSPSLDGENPDKDPTVLIRTAIRTCKGLTGIDLSNCSQWYRFVELYYHRSDHKNKEKETSTRIETVVIFLPDVNSCLPNLDNWQRISETYKSAVDDVIARKTAAAKATIITTTTSTTTNTTISSTTTTTTTDQNIENSNPNNETSTLADNSQSDETASNTGNNNNVGVTSLPDQSSASSSQIASTTINKPVENSSPENAEDGDNNEKTKPELIHYSKLDLKTMKVKDIQAQLIARNLPHKGVRNFIMTRLLKALTIEKNNERKTDETLTTQNDIPKDDINDTNPINEQSGDSQIKDDITTDEKMQEIEELEDWIDIMDVDLNDIVILDEYDSSKNPEDGQKELDEKEKSQLIRRYTLPTAPHIIVHPNKTIKGGKFDCSVMSLSVLLDYHLEDTKERFFEVSLFAELFNEMLMRDFGFNIYKELYLYKEVSQKKDDETHPKKEEKQLNKEDEPTTENNEQKNHESGIELDRQVPKGEEEDSQSSKSATDRKRKLTKERDVAVANDKKMIIVKPQLLLSFLYFDPSHCGYIFEKDLEDLFIILGLNLSRSQIRKVLSKLTTKQAIYYKKLSEKEELLGATPIIEDNAGIAPDDLKKIALGNRQFDFVFDINNTGRGIQDTDSNDGQELVNYNGAVIHVGKLIDQIKRTEIAHADLEKIHTDLRKQHNELQKEHSRSSGKIKDLQSEVKSLNKKVAEFDQNIFSLSRKHKDQLATLSYIYNRVSPYFVREKEKDKDHKTDREKDAEKDKEKEKDKDKEKLNKEKEKDREKEKDGKEKEKSKDSPKDTKCLNEIKMKTDSNGENEVKENTDAETENDTNSSK